MSLKRKIATTAAAAALLAGMGIPALAQQKPPPLEPGATRPGGKPAPLASPAPAAPPAAPPPAAAAPAAPAVPADEPAAVARLRSLLPPNSTLNYAAAETTDPARGAVRLTAVTLRNGARSVTADELILDGLREDGVAEAIARNLTGREGEAVTFTLAELRLGGMVVQRPPDQQLMPDMIRADAIRLQGFAVPDPEASIAFRQLDIEEYGPGRPTRLALSDLDIGMPRNREADRVRLGRLLARGLDAAALLRAAVEQQPPPPLAAGRQALEMEDLQVGAGGRTIVSVASARASGEQDAQGSGTGSLAIRGIRVEPMPGLDEWLRRFGYDALVLELSMDGRYDAPTGRVEVSSLSFGGRDIGALGLSFVIDGATQKAMEALDFSGIRLISAGVRYVDQSLYARFMRDHAREMGAPEQQLREQYAAMAGGFLTAPGKSGLDGLREAVQRFIRGQAREIEVTARPPQPLSIEQFQGPPPGGPAEIQQLLGLAATAR
ncbi:hypothetical protein GCM10010964_43820 [Caldovatus sediminis]|uniref:Uncharacterized protein n=1 Tax=Caldovatus sediminis TaxID=2041189 RepID=A0A8J3EEG7_9PROT|nr:hypothetical protein [Caldovatus sediminis]GGG51875.1 hypothetical protein GCM10010964_43820 [Caldovatus sediminis]